MKKILLLCVLLLTQTAAHADRCDDQIKMDGLLTKAKKSCPFSYYAFRFQQDSQVCMDKKGKQASKELFLKGDSTFDGLAAKMGKEALCQKLLKDFPMTVKP
jgi:hypothetical protein